MNEYRSVLERAGSNFAPLDLELESILRRRDRKRRNQRIAAGVVGIAVFVAAIWVVSSVSSLDRNQTSPGPAGEVTGPATTEPAETAPPAGNTSTVPDQVIHGTCSDGARSRLELTLVNQIEVRFEVHRSPAGHSWHIRLRHAQGIAPPDHWPDPFFEGTRVASDSGDVVVERYVHNRASLDLFKANAWDTQTGQTCKAQGPFA
jgi:hypothetical protein